MEKSLKNTRYLTTVSIFVAIELMIGLIPNIGYIPIGAMHLTIIHIPVIIGAILLGPKAGGMLGGRIRTDQLHQCDLLAAQSD